PLKAAGMFALTLAVGAVLCAPFWGGLDTLRGPMTAAMGDPARTARSLADLIRWLLKETGQDERPLVVRLAWGRPRAVMAAFGARALLRARSVEDVLHHALVIFLAYCMVVPWFQPWYATWLLPFLLVERDARLRNAVAIYTVLCAVQYGVPLDPWTSV